MKKNPVFNFGHKVFSELIIILFLTCGFSSPSKGKIIVKDPSKNEKITEKVKQKKNSESTTMTNKKSSEKKQIDSPEQTRNTLPDNHIENEETKSNAKIMLNFNIRFGNLFQNYTASGLGEIANAKSNILSGSLTLMYGFDFGLILGATYSADSTKRITTKNIPFKSEKEYKNKNQTYGLTIGYHKRKKETSNVFALFTYFPTGSCNDSEIDNCSLKNGYQLSLGRIFTVISNKNFTMAIGPRINFIETNMTGMMRKLPKRYQKTTLQKRFLAPAISSWFMW